MPSPETRSHSSKPQRVLACVLCQHRKIKCDRKFPCTNCIKSGVQCVPASLAPRQRRRRFPERDLLERLRKYEDLLRQNNINFEPLHKPLTGDKESPIVEGGYGSDDQQPEEDVGADMSSPSTTVKSEKAHGVKNFWHAMNKAYRESDDDSDSSRDDMREAVVKNVWDQLFGNNDHLLFGSRNTSLDLSTLHPKPVHIFRLWQIYLDNVNPLLKVIHAPTLQGCIIEAASNLTNIDPILEALMFSIYCVSILSLPADECQAIFASSQENLLTAYQFACQEALLNCSFLRSSHRYCLTALYLYLLSVRPRTVPQSLSSMLGVAIRIAQRMGIHSESALAECTPFEAEMRRRLWWSLVIFDTRIGELADSKAATLAPTWDCKIPLNVDDSDLRAEMKEPPAVHGKSTESLFVVVRSELADLIRHAMFYLDSTNPILKPVAKNFRRGPTPEGGELVAIEKTIEDKYLKLCDADNPLHFMIIWTTRAYLAKCRLLEYFSRYSSSSMPLTEAQRDTAFAHGLTMLECDTKLMISPLTKGFLWLTHCYFPLPAYMQVIQDLRRRPLSGQAEQAWEVMSDNYEARFALIYNDDIPFFKVFTKIILHAWEAREAAFEQSRDSLVPSRIVSSIRQKLAQMTPNGQNAKDVMDLGIDQFLLSRPMGFDSHSLLYSIGAQGGYPGSDAAAYSGLSDLNQLGWTAMDWQIVNGPAAGD